MLQRVDSKERSKSGKHLHGQSWLWPQPTRIVTHGELAQAKQTPRRQGWEGWLARPRAHHTTPQHCWYNTGQSYLHEAAWGWHSASILGQALGSVMAFLFLAWTRSHQFDNVILPQLCGFSPTALNCSPPPQRPTDASHPLLLLACLWALTLQTLLSSSLCFFCSHVRIQEP